MKGVERVMRELTGQGFNGTLLLRWKNGWIVGMEYERASEVAAADGE